MIHENEERLGISTAQMSKLVYASASPLSVIVMKTLGKIMLKEVGFISAGCFRAFSE